MAAVVGGGFFWLFAEEKRGPRVTSHKVEVQKAGERERERVESHRHQHRQTNVICSRQRERDTGRERES